LLEANFWTKTAGVYTDNYANHCSFVRDIYLPREDEEFYLATAKQGEFRPAT
jgi:hypothetical protein